MEGTDDTYLDERYPGKGEHMTGFIPDRRPLGARHKNGEHHFGGTGFWDTDISRVGWRIGGVHSVKGKRILGRVLMVFTRARRHEANGLYLFQRMSDIAELRV